ncbi:MAG TPA: mechanosensitive ion channel family protein [Burkholderiales bacterium]|nr:mechanosensitive ion channel family protein [Burkholderiales bacterium]
MSANGAAIRNTLGFLGLCLLAQLAGAGLLAAGVARAGAIVHDVAILATGIALIRFAGLVLFRVALPAIRISTPRIVEDIIVVAAYVAWGLLRLRLAGMDLASLVTTSAVITAVIAFAMQDTLGNLLGGLLLELDDSIAIGDWVKVDDLSGRVAEIHWRHTVILTRNNERVIVPNGALMKTRFMVIGNPDQEQVRWRRWIWFDVEYGVAPSRVLALAEQAMAAAEVPNVAAEPRPNCVLMEFAQSYCRYALRYYLSDPRPDDATDTRVRVLLFAALRRAGIELAFPEFIVHTVKENEERQAALRAREIERRLAALRGVELFSALEEGELRALADRLVYAPFAAGDVMTRQGAVAHWLYILTAGEAEVWIDAPGGRHAIAGLRAGDVFGEMGMMTGAPRRATVAAKSDVECYRLDKAGFADIIRSRPSIAEDLSRVLAEREGRLVQVSDAARADAANVKSRSATLLERMRGFFGLDESAPRG